MIITKLIIQSEHIAERDYLVCRATVDGEEMYCAGLGLTTDGGKWSGPDAVATTLEQFAAAIRRMERSQQAA